MWELAHWQFGIVADPAPADERYAGRLVIPNITSSGVAGIKYRCIQDHDCKEHDHPKYTQPHGQTQRLYNTVAFHSGRDIIGISEGELDAVSAHLYLDIPTIGIPGATVWDSYSWFWQLPFRDFKRVIIFADGDKAGKDFASHVAADIPQSEIFQCGTGYDVNSMAVKGRADEMIYRIFGGTIDL
jgi:hypothetical protein